MTSRFPATTCDGTCHFLSWVRSAVPLPVTTRVRVSNADAERVGATASRTSHTPALGGGKRAYAVPAPEVVSFDWVSHFVAPRLRYSTLTLRDPFGVTLTSAPSS